MCTKEIQKLISFYLDGQISGDKRKILERHLKQCPSCSAILKEGQEYKKRMQDLHSLPLPALSSALARRFYQSIERRPSRQGFFYFLRRPAFVSAAALAIVLFLIFLKMHHHQAIAPSLLEGQQCNIEERQRQELIAVQIEKTLEGLL